MIISAKYKNSNSIIYLASKGWSCKEMVEFFGFMESHQPTENEVKAAIERAEKNGEK